MIKKIVSILVMVVLSLAIVTVAKEYKSTLVNLNSGENAEDSNEDLSENVVIWYSYGYYEEYLEKVAENYEAIYNVKVTLKYVDGSNMLEAIAEANETGEGIPDLYIAGSEHLEKAYLMGICKKNTSDKFTSENFLANGLEAATYKDSLYAYPLGFETGIFVYNTKYVTNVPKSFDDIKKFADNFNSIGGDELTEDEIDNGETPTESDTVDYSIVESILVWDADSMLYNYGFIGNYISFEGNYSDKNYKVVVDEEKITSSINYYKELYNYFALANEADNYSKIVSDFAEDKIVFSIMNIESLRELDKSGVDYGVCPLPVLSNDLGICQLALTDLVFVNPYSNKTDKAEAFAIYLTNSATYSMYDSIGLLPAKKLKLYENFALKSVAEGFDNSCALPSTLLSPSYWSDVEDLFRTVNESEELDGIMEAFIDKLNSYIK